MRREFRLSGFGGQGILILGWILGMAATIYDKYYVLQIQSYGPESRGGTSHSDVIIADREIHNPVILNSHILLAMSQQAFNEFKMRVYDGGIILYDSTIVKVDDKTKKKLREKKIRLYGVDATSNAEELGHSIVANIILVGALTSLDNTVQVESIRHAILYAVPPKTVQLNEKAFNLGVKLGADLKHEAL